MKRLTIGILAHVDSGKTTLSEAMLYASGTLRKLGRVDHGNAFLDTHALEKQRGITIFSKQAELNYSGCTFTLLDTPGHVDFSAETERALGAMDYAILVISAPDGVQSHTETLFRLLKRAGVPTFVFVNKTDISSKSRSEILAELTKLSAGFIDFSADRPINDFYEELATCSEDMLNEYLAEGIISDEKIASAVKSRLVFPCCFGSALKLSGVDGFLDCIARYTLPITGNAKFGAKVFKIATDAQGARLTFIKVTSGSLKVKSILSGTDGSKTWNEKADQLRIYSGAKFRTVDEAFAGSVCAVCGLTRAKPGDGLGIEPPAPKPMLEPVLTYSVQLGNGLDAAKALAALKRLEDEDPELHIIWDERLKAIHVRLMGEIQLEVLQSLMKSRFNMDISFSQGGILYKETIANKVEGVGHYEPLRHYAEVHLILEPLKRGSGLVFASKCPEDKLDKNWQRLILTHLMEKTHIGVLTGSPITDMKITLVSGRSHIKHTEGGDFRQATYRAVRQGLMQAENVLLEPWYEFSLTIPAEYIGRALNDMQLMCADFSAPEQGESSATIRGFAPVSAMQGYSSQLALYTRGMGKLSLIGSEYRECHNSAEVISQIGYDVEADTFNTADSVFCSHGAGHTVKWDKVFDNMHLERALRPQAKPYTISDIPTYRPLSRADEAELIRIYERTYGPIKNNPLAAFRRTSPKQSQSKAELCPFPTGPDYLLVDGYNIIFAWDDLSAIAKDNMDLARSKLINLMCNYKGVRQCELILVFDAYRIKGHVGSIEKVNNITVVYTKEAETADTYIEKATHELSRNYRVEVAASDRMEQIIIAGNGAARLSANEFRKQVDAAVAAMRDLMEEYALREKPSAKLAQGRIVGLDAPEK